MEDIQSDSTRSEADLRPTPHPQVFVSPLDNDSVLYDPRVGRGYVLNTTGARIWELCDGVRTVNAIATEIAAAYGIDFAVARADVQELMHELGAAGLLVTPNPSA